MIIWSAPGRQDLREIVTYISNDDPGAAARVRRAIGLVAEKLAESLTGRPGRTSATYEKSVANLPCILAYVVRGGDAGEVVIILRVIHTARDWPGGGWPEP